MCDGLQRCVIREEEERLDPAMEVWGRKIMEEERRREADQLSFVSTLDDV